MPKNQAVMKPSVAHHFIEKFTKEGDLILDCFGVGTTGIVARELERNFIGLKKLVTMKYLVMLVE
jgi:DNA modification methylase